MEYAQEDYVARYLDSDYYGQPHHFKQNTAVDAGEEYLKAECCTPRRKGAKGAFTGEIFSRNKIFLYSCILCVFAPLREKYLHKIRRVGECSELALLPFNGVAQAGACDLKLI